MAFLLFFSSTWSAINQSISRRRAGKALARKIIERHLAFWKEHPALILSLTLLIGTSAPLFSGHYVWPILWGVYLLLCRYLPHIFFLIASIFYGFCYQIPEMETQEIQGIFSPSILQPHHSPFERGLVLKGTLSTLSHALPCSIYIRGAENTRPIANQSYLVKGKLEQRGPYDFVLKPKEWKAVKNSWSLAEMRYQIKEKFRKILTEKISSKKASLFLSSITTGDVEDRMLRYEFGRLGLQHILAISGFHFGILIAFFAFCLRLFLSRRAKILVLFLCVNAYFLFVGSSPAVERSYLTALFYLLGQMFHRPSSGLNLLGCSLGTELICNPIIANNMGFQLSFLSSAAILLFLPPLEKKVSLFLPKRNSKEILELNLSAKHGYLLSSFLRKSISLTLAINFVLFPLLLYHFHQFPLFSFLYNLFFPFLIGLSLFLLLTSLVFHLLFPPIAECLYSVTNSFTHFLLELTSHPPLAIDFSIQTAQFSIPLVIGYLFILGFWRISCIQKSTDLFRI